MNQMKSNTKSVIRRPFPVVVYPFFSWKMCAKISLAWNSMAINGENGPLIKISFPQQIANSLDNVF